MAKGTLKHLPPDDPIFKEPFTVSPPLWISGSTRSIGRSPAASSGQRKVAALPAKSEKTRKHPTEMKGKEPSGAAGN
jgi:hypothetical protein